MFLRVSQYKDSGTRENQEDAILYSSEKVFATHGFMAVLSDGMGGLLDGEKFSKIATETMIGSFEKGQPEKDMGQELLHCYEKAQQEALKRQLRQNQARRRAQSTQAQRQTMSTAQQEALKQRLRSSMAQRRRTGKGSDY